MKSNILLIGLMLANLSFADSFSPKGMEKPFELPIGVYLEELAISSGYQVDLVLGCNINKRVPVFSRSMDVLSQLKNLAFIANDEQIKVTVKESTKVIEVRCPNKK